MATPISPTVAVNRVESIELHLRYLRSVAANPNTIDNEIARRQRQIELHLVRLQELTNLKSTVRDQIIVKEAALARARRTRNELKLAAKIARFRQLAAELDAMKGTFDVDFNTEEG